MPYLFLVCLVGLALGALALVLAGETLTQLMPVVRKSEEMRSRICKFVPKNVDGVAVLDSGQKRCEEVMDSATPQELHSLLKNQRFCLVWIGVFFLEHQLKKTVRELRVYSALFILLLILGVLANLQEIATRGIAGLPDAVLTPHVVPILELVMIFYLIVRFFSVQSLVYATYPHFRARRRT